MSMMKPDEVAPRARNHYREEEYFSLNVRNGVIRNTVGTRVLTIPEELIAGLHAGLVDETGAAAAAVVLYQCGKWWGKQFVRRHGLEVRQFFQMDVAELPLHFYDQVLRRVWALHGWGKLEVDLGLRAHGFVEVTVLNAIYSDVVGNIGKTSDHLVAGLLASVLSDAAGRELECVETACRSKGDQRCSFIIGVKNRTDVVATWLAQGKSRSEVAEAIASGTLK